tara:strand:- start:8976 stop:9686 length:711 start_codon:yes stop_codon:yes gene_type:complete
MKLLVQFPTFARANKFLEVLNQYVMMSSDSNELEFNINCDSEDETMKDPYVQQRVDYIFSKKPNVKYNLWYDYGTEKISAINNHIDGLEFDVLVCASDDMVPKVDDWDKEISEAMDEHFPDLDGCVHFDDGNTHGKLITFSILGRKLYERFGYIYHPDYKSLYCDDEFTEVVRDMGREQYIDKIIITHEHYSVKGTQNEGDLDLAAQKTLHYSGRDHYVFIKRKEMGFPKNKITVD